jgi:aryl-alcohol dehydrogenase-like predicted oxidoreductase
VEGVPDWTYDVVARGIDDALRRMHTDVIDVFFLHSCPQTVLDRGDVVRALDDAKRAGKVNVTGYSGENEALRWAVDGHFGAVQCSVNVCDQGSLGGSVARAASREMGVVAKRPIANAPWRFAERPTGDYCETYWERLRQMGGDALRGELEWLDLMIRFAAFAPGVSTAILGTSRVENLEAAIRSVERGPLDAAAMTHLREAFRPHEREWSGQI